MLRDLRRIGRRRRPRRRRPVRAVLDRRRPARLPGPGPPRGLGRRRARLALGHLRLPRRPLGLP